MYLRAGSDIPDFSLYKDRRIDCFQRFDRLLGLAHIFGGGQGRHIKDDGVKPGIGSLHRLREGVRMICIKEDREVEFLPQTSDESGNLANPTNSRSPSDKPTMTGTWSSRAAVNTAFSSTRSEALKWPIAAPFSCASRRRSP